MFHVMLTVLLIWLALVAISIPIRALINLFPRRRNGWWNKLTNEPSAPNTSKD